VNKKQNIIQAAARLFAEQGFEGTTTLQIAKEAGVTGPLIYYHFKGKDDLFSHILGKSFKEYFSRLEAVEREPGTTFQRIEALLDFHFRFVEEMPDETTIGVSTSPAKLKNPERTGRNKGFKFSNIWAESYRNRLTGVILPNTCAFPVSCTQPTPRFGNH
jgi:AcrR family transcriptional regulator